MSIVETVDFNSKLFSIWGSELIRYGFRIDSVRILNWFRTDSKLIPHWVLLKIFAKFT